MANEIVIKGSNLGYVFYGAFIALLVVKVAGIDISWWWVFSPLLVQIGLAVVIVALTFFVSFLMNRF